MESLPIHPYDIVMLVVLAGTTLFGAWKGMAWQLASFLSLVLSCVVATRYSPVLAPYLSRQAPWNRFLAMLILLVATSLAVWLVFRLVAGIIDRVRLRDFDRQMGALFGLAKGVLLCLVITFFSVTLSERLRASVLASRSGYYTTVLIERAKPVLPEEVRQVVGKYLDELDRRLTPPAAPQPPRADRDNASLAEQLRQRARWEIDQGVEQVVAGAEEAVRRASDELLGGPSAEPDPRPAESLAPVSPPERGLPAEPAGAQEDEGTEPAVAGGSPPQPRPVVYVVVRQNGQTDQVWEVPLAEAGETVREAISRLTGLPDLADRDIFLARPGAGGQGGEQILPVDFNRRTQTVSPATNYPLHRGDRFVIAERSGGDAARR